MTVDVTLPLGLWIRHDDASPELAQQLEQAGFAALWLGNSPDADLGPSEQLLSATDRLAVGTSIVNVWTAPAGEVAASFHALDDAHPGRFLLGVGAGHREANADYRKPYAALVDYLDDLDAAGVPQDRRALAALGPKVLELARARTAGALPYLVTPDHTRAARAALGPDRVLVVEQKVVLDPDPERGREIGRRRVGPYLDLQNYRANLRRIGFTADDVTDGGSDRLIDALAVHGDATTITSGLRKHLDAGADQVAIQVLSDDGQVLPTVRALAESF